jgi:hypothetical protein
MDGARLLRQVNSRPGLSMAGPGQRYSWHRNSPIHITT